MSQSEDVTLASGSPSAAAPSGDTSGQPTDTPPRRRRRAKRSGNLTAGGEPLQWLTGGALVVSLAMVAGLVGLILYQGLKTFWPQPVLLLKTHDGRRVFGESFRDEEFTLTRELYAQFPEETRAAPGAPFGGQPPESLGDFASFQASRREFRTGNFELSDSHFTWVGDFEIASEEQPEWALVIERLTNGRFYGEPLAFLRLEPWAEGRNPEELAGEAPDSKILITQDRGISHLVILASQRELGDEIVARVLGMEEGPTAAWEAFQEAHGPALELRSERTHLEKVDLGILSANLESARLATIDTRLRYGAESEEHRSSLDDLERLKVEQAAREIEIKKRIQEIEETNAKVALWMTTASGQTKAIPVAEVTIAYPANQLGLFGKLGIWLERGWEFLSEDPREANTEGGVLPAIFGTVVMTLIMCLAVVPFGVLAALYLREYSKGGFVVSAVRVAVNNLAGVPSIVFGVFGLGFFCYGVGKYIDGGPARGLGFVPWTNAGWLLALGGLFVLVFSAIVLGVRTASSRSRGQTRATVVLARMVWVLWLGAAVLTLLLVVYTPFFGGLFVAQLEDGKPTYGTSGMLWASLTLALLTLPVVIVATEEALSAVPSSMREGSYACGASKWQTVRRIVLPRAMPGILTGTILAMARGAGEVAPLMLVGVVKMSKKLAVDGIFPYVHPERSFMHLGFNIYDVGFKSQNSEAGKPMVFTTTLLLVAIVAMLNLFAVWLRARLRRRFVDGAF